MDWTLDLTWRRRRGVGHLFIAIISLQPACRPPSAIPIIIVPVFALRKTCLEIPCFGGKLPGFLISIPSHCPAADPCNPCPADGAFDSACFHIFWYTDTTDGTNDLIADP